MDRVTGRRVRAALRGAPHPRRAIVGTVVGLLTLASLAFILGATLGLYEHLRSWLSIAVLVAVAAGVVGAGLLPTVGSVWLVSLWGYAFPPLAGFLSGAWTGSGRYTTPRNAALEYGSARAELLGGLEASLTVGLAVAVVLGVIGYGVGTVLRGLVDAG